nr:multidrug resistance efflux transporter family protein [Pullulanibacillus pueri]
MIGIFSALFFSVTFILNRAMELDGGSWVWSASFRFFFMLPILLVIVGFQKNIMPVLRHLKTHPLPWLIWSTVGFGLFYAPMTFAAAYGPGWLVAATFQLTIIAGTLLVPFLSPKSASKQKIPLRSLLISFVILLGVFLIQFTHADVVSPLSALLCIVPLILSAFAYPLGNRQMMQVVGETLNTFQRILGMTIASLPFWLLLSLYGVTTQGLPTSGQLLQTLIVALSSGIIATALFFYATERVKGDNQKLAAVEATQSGEVIFALLGELLFLNAPLPDFYSIIGILLVIIGMIFHSLQSVTRKTERQRMNTVG